MYKVYKDSDYVNNCFVSSFVDMFDAEMFINGCICQHVMACGRGWWNVERESDKYTITIGSTFTTYRIEREV